MGSPLALHPASFRAGLAPQRCDIWHLLGHDFGLAAFTKLWLTRRMSKEHLYTVTNTWADNKGCGTASYTAYGRDFTLSTSNADKPTIAGSADPAFMGDANGWNPEELFVASVSSCHKLWYLHFAQRAGLCVLHYEDTAQGIMVEDGLKGGRFTSVTLRPISMVARASALAALEKAGTLPNAADALDTPEAVAALNTLNADIHNKAHAACFVAASLSCPVTVEGSLRLAESPVS